MRTARALPVPALVSALVTALVPVLALAGCTSGGTDPVQESPTSSAVADGSGITVDDVDPADVIAEATFDVVDQPGDTVTIGIESLVAHGKTMELRLVVTPDFASVAAEDDVSIYDTSSGSNWYPVLTDRDHLKQYYVLSETGLRWETDRVYASAVNGASVRYQAWFAAPEDDVDTLDLLLIDAWPQFEDVPVTYED